MALTNQDASVVNRLGQPQFENLGLKTALQKVFDFQAEHVIELHARFFQHTDTDQSAKQRIT